MTNSEVNPSSPSSSKPPSTTKRAPRIIRRKKKTSSATSSSSSTTTIIDPNEIPPHIQNNTQLHHVISTTLPPDYEFEIPKTIWRIERSCATSVALQLPEGLTMYASTIGDILVKFAYRFQPPQEENDNDNGESSSKSKDRSNKDSSKSKPRPKEIKSLSILGDVTYGACCIDDLSARALGCDLLVHYGHSCLVPLTCTVIPCLYVFVEIRVDVGHLVECVRLTFEEEERLRRLERQHGEGKEDVDESSEATPTRIIEALCMGTVQFRSAVVESSQRLNGDVNDVPSDSASSSSSTNNTTNSRVLFQAIVPQAKPLSPGEVLGCTAPSGLATMDFQAALSKTRRRRARKAAAAEDSTNNASSTTTNLTPTEDETIVRERVMIFLADGRFHLEAAMISNPSLRALRYDPYGKTLTEEKYEIVQMKRLRREAIRSVRNILGIRAIPPTRRVDVIGGSGGDDIANSVLRQPMSSQLAMSSSKSQSPSDPSSSISSSSSSSSPITVGIILGTLGRQGNPAILSRIRSLLHSRGIRSVIVLLSEIFPKKLEMMSSSTISSNPANGGGVRAWVQIACPRLSIDWGHHFCVPVLSPFELFVALGEVVGTSLWVAEDDDAEDAKEEKVDDTDGYPMDFYSKSGGPWANYYESNRERKVVSYGT
mmetsp:Transcript_2359/g.4334  ORF Transcript_2359/g.4334 Transcript_2359/m.4334 type:complete len:655 (-) Transcript_2359:1101-3065(-)